MTIASFPENKITTCDQIVFKQMTCYVPVRNLAWAPPKVRWLGNSILFKIPFNALNLSTSTDYSYFQANGLIQSGELEDAQSAWRHPSPTTQETHGETSTAPSPHLSTLKPRGCRASTCNKSSRHNSSTLVQPLLSSFVWMSMEFLQIILSR
jgi:hypothetical protein